MLALVIKQNKSALMPPVWVGCLIGSCAALRLCCWLATCNKCCKLMQSIMGAKYVCSVGSNFQMAFRAAMQNASSSWLVTVWHAAITLLTLSSRANGYHVSLLSNTLRLRCIYIVFIEQNILRFIFELTVFSSCVSNCKFSAISCARDLHAASVW